MRNYSTMSCGIKRTIKAATIGVGSGFLCRDLLLYLYWNFKYLPQSRIPKSFILGWCTSAWCCGADLATTVLNQRSQLQLRDRRRLRSLKQQQRSLQDLRPMLQMSKENSKFGQSHMTPVLQQQKYDRGQRGCCRNSRPVYRSRSGTPAGQLGHSAGYSPACHLVTTLQNPCRCVTPLTVTWAGGKKIVRRSSRSTHLVSINWPVPWHRRGVDPILICSGPVPAALGSGLPLHSRSLQAYSPFLHCGPGPFSLCHYTIRHGNAICTAHARKWRHFLLLLCEVCVYFLISPHLFIKTNFIGDAKELLLTT